MESPAQLWLSIGALGVFLSAVGGLSLRSRSRLPRSPRVCQSAAATVLAFTAAAARGATAAACAKSLECSACTVIASEVSSSRTTRVAGALTAHVLIAAHAAAL